MRMKLGKITTNFNKLIKEIYTHVILGPLVIKNTLDSSKKPSVFSGHNLPLLPRSLEC